MKLAIGITLLSPLTVTMQALITLIRTCACYGVFIVILAMPTTSCKQTQLIDDIMHTHIDFVLCTCKTFGNCLFMDLKMHELKLI